MTPATVQSLVEKALSCLEHGNVIAAKSYFEDACAIQESQRAREAPGEGGGLKVHAAGAWFELPSGKRIDVARRRTLRRLLATLAGAHAEAPGTVLQRARIVTAVWSGE